MRLQQGFSLVELMVTVALLTILITVAIPSFNSSLQRANAASLADSLINSLNYAKSEAISRNQRVYLCARNAAGNNCLAAAANWNNGWLIRLTTGDETIRDVVTSNPNAVVTLSDANGAQNHQRLVYRPASGILLVNGAVETIPNNLSISALINGCNNPQLNTRRVVSIAVSGLMTVAPREPCL